MGASHAADGRHDGQQSLADVRQLAHRQLVLHLQAHQQEKHGHEYVVDHMRQRHARERVAEEEARLGMPEFQERLVRAVFATMRATTAASSMAPAALVDEWVNWMSFLYRA